MPGYEGTCCRDMSQRHTPCKMATGIPAGSRQESRFLPGSCREMKNLAGKRNFPAGILTGSWQEKILAGILARIPARVSVPGVILPRPRWSRQDNRNLGKTTTILARCADSKLTVMRLQKKYYKLWYVESEQTLARSIAIVIFIRVRFKQRSCMARYVDE